MKLTSFGFSISGYSRVLFHFANCEIVELTIKIYANSLKNVEKEGLFSRKTKNGYSGFAKYRILNFRSRALKSNSRPFSKKNEIKNFKNSEGSESKWIYSFELSVDPYLRIGNDRKLVAAFCRSWWILDGWYADDAGYDGDAGYHIDSDLVSRSINRRWLKSKCFRQSDCYML